jgi:hypothetical protein
MQQNFSVTDNSGDREFFTIVPNYILNHSTAIDQALYLQLKRLSGDGKKDYCYPSFSYLQKHLHIGVKALRKSFKYLIDHKWVDNLGKRQVHTAGGLQWVNAYKINNIWKQNQEEYKPVDKGSSKSTPLTQGGAESIKGALKSTQGGLGSSGITRTYKELKQEQCVILKNWNEKQNSPLKDFNPENIVNKHSPAKVAEMVKVYGKMNGGFSLFLKALKNL